MKPWARLAGVGAALALLMACAGPEAERIREESAQSHYDIGLVALTENNLVKAISEFEAAVEENPRAARHHHALGNAYLRNRQFDEAIRALRRAVELDPRLSDAFNDLGVAYMQKRMWDPAIEAFRRALANPQYLNPERAYVNLGNVQAAQGRYEDAVATFRKLLDLFPQSVDGHFFLGQALRRQEKFAEAKEQVEQAIKLDGSIPAFHHELGLLLVRMGDRAGAWQSFRRALDLGLTGREAEEASRYLRELK